MGEIIVTAKVEKSVFKTIQNLCRKMVTIFNWSQQTSVFLNWCMLFILTPVQSPDPKKEF